MSEPTSTPIPSSSPPPSTTTSNADVSSSDNKLKKRPVLQSTKDGFIIKIPDFLYNYWNELSNKSNSINKPIELGKIIINTGQDNMNLKLNNNDNNALPKDYILNILQKDPSFGIFSQEKIELIDTYNNKKRGIRSEINNTKIKRFMSTRVVPCQEYTNIIASTKENKTKDMRSTMSLPSLNMEDTLVAKRVENQRSKVQVVKEKDRRVRDASKIDSQLLSALREKPYWRIPDLAEHIQQPEVFSLLLFIDYI